MLTTESMFGRRAAWQGATQSNHLPHTTHAQTHTGTLMLTTEGMSAGGLQRKATCQALFSKMLYLTEHEPLVAQDSEAFRVTDLRNVST